MVDKYRSKIPYFKDNDKFEVQKDEDIALKRRRFKEKKVKSGSVKHIMPLYSFEASQSHAHVSNDKPRKCIDIGTATFELKLMSTLPQKHSTQEPTLNSGDTLNTCNNDQLLLQISQLKHQLEKKEVAHSQVIGMVIKYNFIYSPIH